MGHPRLQGGIKVISRILEPEVMDCPAEALAYDQMDHVGVNRAFVEAWAKVVGSQHLPNGARLLDVGTGTALIPIEILKLFPALRITAIDMARAMLDLAKGHLERLGLTDQIDLQFCDAKNLPFGEETFASVVSNSIIHHIPAPVLCLTEMVRVCVPGGWLFVRDLCRPDSEAELNRLVELHAGDAPSTQKQLFGDSLHAALTLSEAKALAQSVHLDPDSVTLSSDRHWTLAVKK